MSPSRPTRLRLTAHLRCSDRQARRSSAGVPGRAGPGSVPERSAAGGPGREASGGRRRPRGGAAEVRRPEEARLQQGGWWRWLIAFHHPSPRRLRPCDAVMARRLDKSTVRAPCSFAKLLQVKPQTPNPKPHPMQLGPSWVTCTRVPL